MWFNIEKWLQQCSKPNQKGTNISVLRGTAHTGIGFYCQRYEYSYWLSQSQSLSSTSIQLKHAKQNRIPTHRQCTFRLSSSNAERYATDQAVCRWLWKYAKRSYIVSQVPLCTFTASYMLYRIMDVVQLLCSFIGSAIHSAWISRSLLHLLKHQPYAALSLHLPGTSTLDFKWALIFKSALDFKSASSISNKR